MTKYKKDDEFGMSFRDMVLTLTAILICVVFITASVKYFFIDLASNTNHRIQSCESKGLKEMVDAENKEIWCVKIIDNMIIKIFPL